MSGSDAQDAAAAAREAFLALIEQPDEQIPVDEAALWIAAEEYPGLDVGGWLSRLDALAAGAREHVGDVDVADDPELVIQGFHDYFFEELGFRGNTDDYYDARNSFLNDVIARRVGIPISLAVIYAEIANRLGWPVFGVGFPGHFLAKWELEEVDVVVDVFHQRILGLDDCEELLARVTGGNASLEPELLAAVSHRAILVRMLSNLKSIWTRGGELTRAIGACDRILALAPQAATILRDRGMLWLQLECHRPALQDLERYLKMSGGGPDAEAVNIQLVELRRRVRRIS